MAGTGWRTEGGLPRLYRTPSAEAVDEISCRPVACGCLRKRHYRYYLIFDSPGRRAECCARGRAKPVPGARLERLSELFLVPRDSLVKGTGWIGALGGGAGGRPQRGSHPGSNFQQECCCRYRNPRPPTRWQSSWSPLFLHSVPFTANVYFIERSLQRGPCPEAGPTLTGKARLLTGLLLPVCVEAGVMDEAPLAFPECLPAPSWALSMPPVPCPPACPGSERGSSPLTVPPALP